MGNRILIFFLGILLFCISAEAEYMKYKDPKRPLNVRIKDLMSRMTLAEKIGQMTQIERKVASEEVMKKYFIGNKLCAICCCEFQFHFSEKIKKV